MKAKILSIAGVITLASGLLSASAIADAKVDKDLGNLANDLFGIKNKDANPSPSSSSVSNSKVSSSHPSSSLNKSVKLKKESAAKSSKTSKKPAASSSKLLNGKSGTISLSSRKSLTSKNKIASDSALFSSSKHKKLTDVSISSESKPKKRKTIDASVSSKPKSTKGSMAALKSSEIININLDEMSASNETQAKQDIKAQRAERKLAKKAKKSAAIEARAKRIASLKEKEASSVPSKRQLKKQARVAHKLPVAKLEDSSLALSDSAADVEDVLAEEKSPSMSESDKDTIAVTDADVEDVLAEEKSSPIKDPEIDSSDMSIDDAILEQEDSSSQSSGEKEDTDSVIADEVPEVSHHAKKVEAASSQQSEMPKQIVINLNFDPHAK